MISDDQQTALMTAIGKRRSRTFSVAFVVFWPISFGVLLLGVGVGVIPNLIVSSALATFAAKRWVKSQRDSIIGAEMKVLGINPADFNARQYIVD